MMTVFWTNYTFNSHLRLFLTKMEGIQTNVPFLRAVMNLLSNRECCRLDFDCTISHLAIFAGTAGMRQKLRPERCKFKMVAFGVRCTNGYQHLRKLFKSIWKIFSAGLYYKDKRVRIIRTYLLSRHTGDEAASGPLAQAVTHTYALAGRRVVAVRSLSLWRLGDKLSVPLLNNQTCSERRSL